MYMCFVLVHIHVHVHVYVHVYVFLESQIILYECLLNTCTCRLIDRYIDACRYIDIHTQVHIDTYNFHFSYC